MNNKPFAENDKLFIGACKSVGLPNHVTVVKGRKDKPFRLPGIVTLTRQASKWRMKKGLAYKGGK